MSNVKNNDPFAAVGNLFNKVVGEAGRVVEERVRHVTEDIDSVGKAVETGGFVGGVMQGLDVISPGHQLAHNIDSLIPGEDLPPALKEGISLGVNVVAGGGIFAAKDAFDLFNEMSKKPQQPVAAGDKPAAERMQTPEAPAAARERSLGNTEVADRMRGFAINESYAAQQSLGGGTVTRTGDTVVIRGTGADDRITVEAQKNGTVKVTVNGESTTLTAREAENIVVVARAGNDNVRVIGLDDVKVLAGTGNDRVYIEGDDAYVVAGGGRDRVTVRGDDARVSGGDGRDTIGVRGDEANVSGGRGRDTINVRGDGARVDGGRGRDNIKVSGDDSRVRGGAGRDTIKNDGGPELVYRGGPGYLEELKNVRESRPDAGFAVDGSSEGFLSNDFIGGEISGGKGPKGPKDDKLKKLEADLDKATRDIERILNDPNLSFEDMIFLLMRAVIKQSESEVKIQLEGEKAGRDADKAARDAGRSEIDGLQGQMNGLSKELVSAKDPKAKEEIQLKMQTLKTKIEKQQSDVGTNVQDKAEQRSERFEELKESLQKVSEMQQALSNIMNTLHQTAMNAIGNIR